MIAHWPHQNEKPRIRAAQLKTGDMVRIGSSTPDEAMAQQGFYLAAEDNKKPTDSTLLVHIGGQNSIVYTPEVLVHKHEFEIKLFEVKDAIPLEAGSVKKGDIVRFSDVDHNLAIEKNDYWFVATDPFVSTGQLVYMVNLKGTSVKRVHKDTLMVIAAYDLTTQRNTA